MVLNRGSTEWGSTVVTNELPYLLLLCVVNCWPSENNGKCDVNIEYELLQDYLELSDVTISIPVP